MTSVPEVRIERFLSCLQPGRMVDPDRRRMRDCRSVDQAGQSYQREVSCAGRGHVQGNMRL
jgi:hypothetical protein